MYTRIIITNYIKVYSPGDKGVGKTCFMFTFATKYYPEEFIPTVFDAQDVKLDVNNNNYVLRVEEMAEPDDKHERTRLLTYYAADAVLLCYDIGSPSSFDSILKHWGPEAKLHAPKAHRFLIGLKSDLRDDNSTIERLNKQNKEPITAAQATGLAKHFQVQAVTNLECSSRKLTGVDDIFIAVAEFVKNTNNYDGKLKSTRKANQGCSIS